MLRTVPGTEPRHLCGRIFGGARDHVTCMVPLTHLRFRKRTQEIAESCIASGPRRHRLEPERALAFQNPFPWGTHMIEQTFHAGRGRSCPLDVRRGRGCRNAAASYHFVRAFAASRRAASAFHGTRPGHDAHVRRRQKAGLAEMQWKSAALPAELPGQSVTFVWSGGMGLWSPGKIYDFRQRARGRHCNVVLNRRQFPGREGLPALYDVLHTLLGLDSAGHFFLTVPKAWVQPGSLQRSRSRPRSGRGGLVFAGPHQRRPAGHPRSRLDGAQPCPAAGARTPPPAGEEARLRLVRRPVRQSGALDVHRPARRSGRGGRLAHRATPAIAQQGRNPGHALPDQRHGLRAL